MRDPRTRRRLFTRIALGAVLALVLAACGEAPQTALDPQGEYARKPDDLFRYVMWIALVVFLLVQGLIIYAVVRFRQRPNDPTLPVQVHGNTKLEIFWTLIPALILAGIAVPTVRTVFELADEPDGAVNIEVIGHRWWWEYRYPDHGGFATANELVIPAGVPVHLRMTSQEAGSSQGAVIHSYWIPALAGKQDVVPGRTTELNLMANEPGKFIGMCTEYCGLSHANMRQYATALTPAEFEEWVEAQNQPAEEPEAGTAAARGRELFGDLGSARQACASCHAVQGLSQAQVGPDLTHFMSRERFAGAILDTYVREEGGGPLDYTDEPNEELLAEWLRNPLALKPMQPEAGFGMPNLGLDDDEISDLVAYLLTLK